MHTKLSLMIKGLVFYPHYHLIFVTLFLKLMGDGLRRDKNNIGQNLAYLG